MSSMDSQEDLLFREEEFHQYHDLMVDLETLDTDRQTSTIIAISAILFSRWSKDSVDSLKKGGNRIFYRKIDKGSNKLWGRTESSQTIEWWEGREEEVKKAVLRPTGGEVGLVTALADFYKFFLIASERTAIKRAWSKGSDFDLIILENLFKEMERKEKEARFFRKGEEEPYRTEPLKCPIIFRDYRGVRGYEDMFPPQNLKLADHHPTNDAIKQILDVQRAWRCAEYYKMLEKQVREIREGTRDKIEGIPL